MAKNSSSNPTNNTDDTTVNKVEETAANNIIAEDTMGRTASAIATKVLNKAEDAISQALQTQSGIPLEPSKEEIARILDEQYSSMFKLPEPCRTGDGLNYSWSWCEADERMLNIYRSRGYLIANRNNAPFLSRFVNHTTGAVTRQKANLHVLMMRSRKYSDAELEHTYNETLGQMKRNPVKTGDELQEMSRKMGFRISQGGYGIDPVSGSHSPSSPPLMFERDGSPTSPDEWVN